MTPEEAQALEPGTTPGPWAHDEVPGPGEDPTRATEVYPQDESGVIAYVQPNAADVALIAAAPDMRATIAAQTWQWGRRGGGGIEWHDTEAGARHHVAVAQGGLVRRPVGPVEAVEE
ncbi:MAG: hypothetical protein ACI38U_14225 [Corynebacterium sp.]|uniref:hypothetical protein n=1 Tax=Corynebacterium sp. TaxID=1720 RepID=UPI003F0E676B